MHQWTGNSDEVSGAIAEVQEIYGAANPGRVRDLLAKHKVKFVIIGPTERREYKAEGLEKLKGMLPRLYENMSKYGEKGTEILQVP